MSNASETGSSAKRIWILTEERPKELVIELLVLRLLNQLGIAAIINPLAVVPVLNADGSFAFRYQVIGVHSPQIASVTIELVTGSSSFVDFLIFWQHERPTPNDIPVIIAEETKTDDRESRNTGVFQRATKFVYAGSFYPDVDAVMLYNLRVDSSVTASDTNRFGARCLATLGVAILGKEHVTDEWTPFSSVSELITARNSIGPPPGSNTPIQITEVAGDHLTISGKLEKAGRLGHDPNVGALTLISASLRALGWEGRIEIVQHGLTSQGQVGSSNKFVHVARRLRIELEGLEIPRVEQPSEYWRYEDGGEKVTTIFLHVAIDRFSDGEVVYDNHAGCERGYFINSSGEALAVTKRVLAEDGSMPRDAEVINLPDLVVVDEANKQVINVEGEKATNVARGIEQLRAFGAFEREYVKPSYPFRVVRTVVLFGGMTDLSDGEWVSFVLGQDGEMFLGSCAPEVFRDAIGNLRDYWAV